MSSPSCKLTLGFKHAQTTLRSIFEKLELMKAQKVSGNHILPMSTTLALFWHLSSVDKKERLDASVKLVSALEQFQAQFVSQQQPQSHSDDEDDEEEGAIAVKGREDVLDMSNSQDVSYSIRRLIRGLASPRESSRLGFAVALTELLSRIKNVTCLQILTLVTDSSKPRSSMTGQEERDVLFAHLFGLMSLIQSGLLIRSGTLHASAPTVAEVSSLSTFTDVLSQLISLGEKKSWLRESAWYVVLLGIDAIHGAEVNWKADAIEAIVQQIFVEYKSWTPEKIAVALKMQSLYPERDWSESFAPTFKNGDLLASANLQVLARIVKESSLEDSTESVKSNGVWKPQLHFVWSYILERYLPGPNSVSAPKGSFQDFFRVVVDESLFSATSSPQRKYWGFQVFQKALSRIDEEHMSMLFTKHFMRSWINHLSNHDTYLHKIAQQTAIEVQNLVKQNPHLGFGLILQLTGVNGSQNFDRLTKTKTISSILSSLDTDGIRQYLDWLFSQVDESGSTDDDAIRGINHKRRWTIEQLFSLIRNGSIPKNVEWVHSILDWLTVHGLFLVNKKSTKNPIAAAVANPPFSDELRTNCRSCLLSCLSELNTHTTILKAGDKTIKASAVAMDGEFWVFKVFKTIKTLEADSKHASLLIETDEDNQNMRQQVQQLVKKLQNTPDSQRETARGAELLLLATTLQHYCTGHEEEADSDSLKVCVEAITHMFPEENKKKRGSRKKKVEDEDENVHEPVDILVDLIIGYLEKSTAFLKTTANQVFNLLSGSVQESTIDLILTQLERRDPTVGEAGEDEELASFAEEEDKGAEEDASESDQSSQVEDDDDEDGVDDEEALTLRNKIEQALRINGIQHTTDETDSEEELMDDEQMMAIDEQLVEVFRSRNSEMRSGKRNAHREAMHFKIRVLDLVDTFVKKQISSPFILRLITPLVDTIIGTSFDEQQLSAKAQGIFSNRLAPKLNQLPPDIPLPLVAKSYQEIHSYARRIHVSSLQTAFKQCSLHLTKYLLKLGAEDLVLDVYRASMVDFFTRKNSALHPTFFEDFLRQNRDIAWKLRQDLLESTDKAINGHRQGQAFHFLHVLLPMVSTMPDPKLEWIAFLPSLLTRVLEVVHVACGEKVTLNSAQLKITLKLAMEALRLTQRHAPEALQEVQKVDSWISLKKDLVGCKRFENAAGPLQICDQITKLVKISDANPNSKTKKRKVRDILSVPEKQEKKRKKMKGDA